ncbi:hypothetical protein CRUP_025234 [Coryphaenoides rupestris]|nr:hypothetical protein CRUP_025234 [Coryphaenoides rupestris]
MCGGDVRGPWGTILSPGTTTSWSRENGKLPANPWPASPATRLPGNINAGLYGNFKAQLRFISDFSISYEGFQHHVSRYTLEPCDDPGRPPFGQRNGLQLRRRGHTELLLQHGLPLEGVPELVCLGGGRRMWSAPLPRCVAECGSSVVNNEGIMLSPNYPMNYDNNHECIYSIQIYDGRDNTAHVLGAFTGSSMLGLTLISTSNHIWLEFYSDPEGTGEGFKLVYSSFELSHCEDPGVPQFGFKVSDQGHFSGSSIMYRCQPGYTLHGATTLKCMTGERRAWDNPLPSCIAECGGRFKGESSGRIISPGYPFPHDMLKVWDGPAENEMSLSELSGSLLPEGIHSTLNIVTVQFETDFYISKSGFAIEFSSNRSGDGREPGDAVSFQCDPGYELQGDDKIDCDWLITVNPDYVLSLAFISFSDREPNYDFLYYHTTGPDSNSPLSRELPRTGKLAGAASRRSSRPMHLAFRQQTASVSYTGFHLEYKGLLYPHL